MKLLQASGAIIKHEVTSDYITPVDNYPFLYKSRPGFLFEIVHSYLKVILHYIFLGLYEPAII